MSLRYFLLFGSTLLLTSNLFAQQWSREDSLWIEKVKSGKIKIELNPETKKAIEEGMLIGTEKPENKLKESPSQLPITREFTDILPEDVEIEQLDLSSLPPSVFLRLDIPDSAKQKSFVYVAPTKDYLSMKIIRIGTDGFYITAHTGDLNPIVKDGQSRGGAMGAVGYGFSMEDILRQLLMPSERAKKRNRKYATAWKFY